MESGIRENTLRSNIFGSFLFKISLGLLMPTKGVSIPLT